jgi:hypothetical protein
MGAWCVQQPTVSWKMVFNSNASYLSWVSDNVITVWNEWCERDIHSFELSSFTENPNPISYTLLCLLLCVVPRIELGVAMIRPHTHCNAIIAVTLHKRHTTLSLTTFRIVLISGVKVLKYWFTSVATWRPGEVKSMGVRNRQLWSMATGLSETKRL